MTPFIHLLPLLTLVAGVQDRPAVQTGRTLPSVPQIGRIPPSTPQRGTPQTGSVPQAVPQRNPDGSVPRAVRRWRPPVTIIYGPTNSGVIDFPAQFNLPYPAYGLVWQRIGNDAVLYDMRRSTIVEVRQRWFG